MKSYLLIAGLVCSFNSFASPVASPASSPSISSTLADVVITIDKEEVINALNDSVKQDKSMQNLSLNVPKFSFDPSTVLHQVSQTTTFKNTNTAEHANTDE